MSDLHLDALRVLNRALAADPDAMHSLVVNRVRCNEAMADDPTIVVYADPFFRLPCQLSALGLINGILGEMGLPLVAAKFADAADEEGCHVLEYFCAYQSAAKGTQ